MDLGFGGFGFLGFGGFSSLGFLGVEHFFEGLGSSVSFVLAFFVLLDIARRSSAFGHEFVNSAFDIEEFLGAGVKGVAFGTNVDVEVFAGAANFEFVATGTSDGHGLVGWVDILFHKQGYFSTQPIASQSGGLVTFWP